MGDLALRPVGPGVSCPGLRHAVASHDQSEWQIEWQIALARACLGLRVLACARVVPGQTPYLRQRNHAVIHGKEKVYGSIP